MSNGVSGVQGGSPLPQQPLSKASIEQAINTRIILLLNREPGETKGLLNISYQVGANGKMTAQVTAQGKDQTFARALQNDLNKMTLPRSPQGKSGEYKTVYQKS